MGCDYYTQIVLVIKYLDSENNEQELRDYDELKRNYCIYSGDPDLDEPVDELDMQCTSYGKKVMYEGNKWSCTQEGKQRIIDLCKGNNINLNAIVSAFKVMS